MTNNYQTLKHELKNHIITIWLNRPEVHNAFNRIMLGELVDILEWIKNNENVRVIIFTGEGKIDLQTGFGKIPEYVGRLAKKHGKRAIALGGSVEQGNNLVSAGIAECRCINPAGISLADAFRDAEKNLALTAARVMIENK